MQQLPRKERVAVARTIDRVGHPLRIGNLRRRRRDERANAGAVERSEADDGRAMLVLQVPAQRPQRMLGGRLVGTVRRDEHDMRTAHAARQMFERIQRVDVGPVQIFENHRNGPPACERFEHARERLVQARFPAFDDGNLRKIGMQTKQFRNERRECREPDVGQLVAHEIRGGSADDVDQRLVRRTFALARVSEERVAALLLDRRCKLGEQARLADAGLAADEDGRPRAPRGDLPDGHEPVQFRRTPDDRNGRLQRARGRGFRAERNVRQNRIPQCARLRHHVDVHVVAQLLAERVERGQRTRTIAHLIERGDLQPSRILAPLAQSEHAVRVLAGSNEVPSGARAQRYIIRDVQEDRKKPLAFGDHPIVERACEKLSAEQVRRSRRDGFAFGKALELDDVDPRRRPRIPL